MIRRALALAALLAGPAAAQDLSCHDEPVPATTLQLQRGTIDCAPARPGEAPALRFTADAKRGTVGKAGLILPFQPLGPGGTVTVSAEMFLPEDSPANSIVLIDAECKHCGLPGNPGLRVYLRRAGLRVDRSKIGERHAWARENPPEVPRGEWVRIGWHLALGTDEATGRSEITLNGTPVLQNAGRTLPDAGEFTSIDRVQIGVTANSNDIPVTLSLRDVTLDLTLPPS